MPIVVPGYHGNTNHPFEQRLNYLELVLSRYEHVQLQATDAFGQLREFTVLAYNARPIEANEGSPFAVSLASESGGQYSVTVADGYVCERIPGAAQSDALYNSIPGNLTNADGTRKKFPIGVGQQVSVVVPIKESGELDDNASTGGNTGVYVLVEQVDSPSIHYIPKAPNSDDTYGQKGYYHYKLAVLQNADENHATPWLENFLAGSHIDHFRDLPTLDNTMGGGVGVGRVFNKFDPGDGGTTPPTYKLRALKQGVAGQIKIHEKQTSDTPQLPYIEIAGNGVDGSAGFSLARVGPSIAETVVISDGLTEVEPTVGKVTIGDDINIEFYDVSFGPYTGANGGLLFGWLNLELVAMGSPFMTLYIREGHIYTADPGYRSLGSVGAVTVLQCVRQASGFVYGVPVKTDNSGI